MPGRDCDTCKHWRPSHIPRLARTYGKCASPRRETREIVYDSGRREFHMPIFAETCRGIPDLCGQAAHWWEAKPQNFELVEDEPRQLDWDDDYEEDD